jgi:hypothetical protein
MARLVGGWKKTGSHLVCDVRAGPFLSEETHSLERTHRVFLHSGVVIFSMLLNASATPSVGEDPLQRNYTRVAALKS